MNDSRTATYSLFSVIVRDEGGDAPAYEAAKNNVQSCIALFQQKKTFKGKPYVRVNAMTERTEFLYIKESIVDGVAVERMIADENVAPAEKSRKRSWKNMEESEEFPKARGAPHEKVRRGP